MSTIDQAHGDALTAAERVRDFERALSHADHRTLFLSSIKTVCDYIRNFAQTIALAHECDRTDLEDAAHRLTELADALSKGGVDVFATYSKKGWIFVSDVHKTLERDGFEPSKHVGLCPDCFAPLDARSVECRQCGWLASPSAKKRSTRKTIDVLNARVQKGYPWVPRRGWSREGMR
jgi:hypothetical protein